MKADGLIGATIQRRLLSCPPFHIGKSSLTLGGLRMRAKELWLYGGEGWVQVGTL